MLHSVIGYWHHLVAGLFVCPSVCDAAHCGSQGWCTGLKVVAYQHFPSRQVPTCPVRHFCGTMYRLATKRTGKNTTVFMCIRSLVTCCVCLSVYPVCDMTGARWCFHANRNSFHGVIPPKPVGSRWLLMWSLDECLEVCAADLRCFAVDFDMDTRTCYVHHNADFADTRGPYPHVNQFVVSQRCRPGNQCNT